MPWADDVCVEGCVGETRKFVGEIGAPCPGDGVLEVADEGHVLLHVPG